MGRPVFGVLGGLVVSGVIITLVEMIGHGFFPLPLPPDPTTTTDLEALRTAIPTLPAGAFLVVLVGWLLGAGIGSWVATRIGGRNRRGPGYVVGGLVFAGAIYNLIVLPHPVWFAMAAVAGIILATVYGTRLWPGPAAPPP